MIVGEVHPSGDVIMPLLLRGPGGTLTISVVVDTGFSDWLTLPREIVQKLALASPVESHYTGGWFTYPSARI